LRDLRALFRFPLGSQVDLIRVGTVVTMLSDGFVEIRVHRVIVEVVGPDAYRAG